MAGLSDEYVNSGDLMRCADRMVHSFRARAGERGFDYPEGLVESVILSLKTVPFVVLTGVNGSGKTCFARLFAENLGATAENGHFMNVGVCPDWEDAHDLFGGCGADGAFVPSAFLDFLLNAATEPEKLFFVCLDDMNLARTELYLGCILSALGNKCGSPLLPDRFFGGDGAARATYGGLSLPENVFMFGAVSNDEGSFPTGSRVLDRVNVIEIPVRSLIPTLDAPPISLSAELVREYALDREVLSPEYSELPRGEERIQDVLRVCRVLQELNGILALSDFEIGYRLRNEIVFYCLYSAELALLDGNVALDRAILQRLLPRIRGGGSGMRELLARLFRFCSDGSSDERAALALSCSDMRRTAERGGCRYPLSAERLVHMMWRYEEDGYASYRF